MQCFHYVFKLVFQLFYISLAELLLQISFLCFFWAHFRVSEATRCAGVCLSSINFPNRGVVKPNAKNILFEFRTEF